MEKLETEELLGYDVVCETSGDCVASIVESIKRNNSRGQWLACINPHTYVMAQKSSAFFQALKSSDWLVPDGIGVVWASRFLGGKISERITGSDIFKEVSFELDKLGGYKVFFLGSTDATLDKLRKSMMRDYPRIEFAGSYSPPFKSDFNKEDIDNIVAAVEKAAPDILWVGLTAPKQELLIPGLLDRLNSVKFAAAIGAVFDFYSGEVKRSNTAFQRLGLEWLPRLIRQPRRLWRRMLISAPIFVLHVIDLKFRNYRGS